MPALPYGDGLLELPPTPRFEIDRLPASAVRPRPGASSLEDLAVPLPDGARSYLVAVSDATRKTGSATFLPALVERIERAGADRVTFIVASGIHRRPTDEEVAAVIGAGLAGRYPVLRHDPLDEARLVTLGRTRAGTTVRVNAAVREHDALILTGAVAFHYYAGFGGGRKAVVPGLAARETVVANHLRALGKDGSRHPAARAGRLAGNPVHRDMAEAAALARPGLLVNSVVGDDGRIERLFVGHWRRAHEAACRYLRRTRTVRARPRPLLIVSAGGAPYDVDLIQAHKAFEAAFPALLPGGTLVLLAACPDGGGHPDFLRAFEAGPASAMAERLRRDFRVYAQTAHSWRAKAERCRLILVSDLPGSTVDSLGAVKATSLEEALAIASRYHRRGARGWWLDHGSRYLIVPEPGRSET